MIIMKGGVIIQIDNKRYKNTPKGRRKMGIRPYKRHPLKYYINLMLTFIMLQISIICQPANAALTNIKDLILDAKHYNGREVTIQGEVIGDVMARRNGTWINIDDESECIGIWIAPGRLPMIDFTGSYKAKGDTLEIEGIFNRACPEHGGETDFHAIKVEVIKKGHPIHHPILKIKLEIVIILLLLTIIVTLLYWHKKWHCAGDSK